ncbi:MAG: YdeI/OmpD-associated family protein [Bacteroidales bacterium]
MKASTVEQYIDSNESWREALLLLREIFLKSKLKESIKWGMPVYTLDNKNVAGFSAFKSYVGIWFYQGVLMKDSDNRLINAQEGITKALRQWRFESSDEIRRHRDTIKYYIDEATENEKKGKRIQPDRNKKLEIPDELQQAFSDHADLKDKFDELTAGRQREYATYISEARRPDTRTERIKKIIPLIMKGIGLNDRYKK